MRSLLTFMLLAAALAAGATQTASAADGWFNGARVELVFANANGQLRIRTNPRPQNAEGANFGCTQSTLILGFSNASDNDDEGVAGLWDIVATANLTGASVDMYLDEVSNGTRVDCYVNRLQANLPASTPNPPNPNPPNPNPPPTRGYYGAFASSNGLAWGYSIDARTQAEADRLAFNRCAANITLPGERCSVQLRIGAGRCVVVYAGDRDLHLFMVWDGVPGQLSDMQQEALSDCRGVGYTDCRRIVSACNSGTSSIAPQSLSSSVMRKR